MRIVSALIAVLGLAAVVRPSYSNEYKNQTLRSAPTSRRYSGRFTRSLQKKSEEFKPCCPIVEEMIQPDAGRNQDGIFVKLYSDKDYKQRFYELKCNDDVIDKPCRFVNKKVESRCVQKWSYTYALVENSPDLRRQNLPTFPTQADGVAYTLDYIEVRSGCSCEVKPKRKKRNKKRHPPNNSTKNSL